jgi:hypothetical protein
MAERNDGMPQRLTKIDDLTLPQLRYLERGDECFYWGEYQAHGGYQAGPTNNLIANLKMARTAQNAHRLRYKDNAIQTCGAALAGTLRMGGGDPVTVVPVPPSKMIGDPEHDDRMLRVARRMVQGTTSDARELIRQTQNYVASHVGGAGGRITPDELINIYEIVDGGNPPNDTIIILDDVLTQGAHFRAMKIKLLESYPDARIYGLFIARAVHNAAADFDVL